MTRPASRGRSSSPGPTAQDRPWSPSRDRSAGGTSGKSQGRGKGGKGKGKRDASPTQSYCHKFLSTGACPFGEKCKFKHITQQAMDALQRGSPKGGGDGRGRAGGAPATVAVVGPVLRVRFSDDLEQRAIESAGERCKVPPLGRGKQWPLHIADYIGTYDYDQKITMSQIIARHSAIDLAEGIGLLGPEPYSGTDSGDDEPWSGSPIHPKEDRRRPVLWRDEALITFLQPEDGFAAYGRSPLGYRECHRDSEVGRDCILSAWDTYDHHGDVPDGPPIDIKTVAPPLLPSASRLRSTGTPEACASSEIQTISRWIMDTGCGTDLGFQADANRCAPDTFPEGKPLAFSTAGGPARTRLKAKLHVTEIDQLATVSVLSSTPAVLSVGRRCMHEGFSFIWPAGKLPYLARPDGLVVPLTVHGDIPYLEPQALACQPIDAEHTYTVASIYASLGENMSSNPVRAHGSRSTSGTAPDQEFDSDATTTAPQSQDEQPAPPTPKPNAHKRKRKVIARESGPRSTVARAVLPAVIPAAEPEAVLPPDPADVGDVAEGPDLSLTHI